MAKVKITQVRSVIGQNKRNKETLKALGLRKINHSVEKEVTPQIQGMIRKVSHLVKIEE
jgi:large subunit ribosomal protein L30